MSQRSTRSGAREGPEESLTLGTNDSHPAYAPSHELAETVRYVVLPTRRNIRTFGSPGGPSIEEYLREVKAVWRACAVGTADKLDVVLDSITPTVRREVKLHCSDDDPEAMLEAMLKIYGEHKSLQEQMAVFYTTKQGSKESVMEFSHRLHAAFEAITDAQQSVGVTVMTQQVLRDQFIAELRNELTKRMLKERVLQERSLTFLAARDYALRWADINNELHLQSRGRDINCAVVSQTEPSVSGPSTRALEDKIDSLSKELSLLRAHVAGPRYDTRPRQRVIRCARCGGLGHLQSRCRQALN
ncbi:unnamed protein product [Candidula unifasciata]|uniref:CCHC-type domain-containing protein n=1 Tax=Candidula unifasciata TaxID=100452 RepID=A0A8S3Z5R5_9EUPU|nr:unnamed protein product [Candidula unifasciata]